MTLSETRVGNRGVKSKKISIHPGRDLLKSVLKGRNARVKVEWVEREKELSVICILFVKDYVIYGKCLIFLI